MKRPSYTETLDLLQSLFPGKMLLGIEEAASVYGCAVGSIRNRICKNAARPFPVKPIRRGGRPKFRIQDIARDLSL